MCPPNNVPIVWDMQTFTIPPPQSPAQEGIFVFLILFKTRDAKELLTIIIIEHFALHRFTTYFLHFSVLKCGAFE